MTSSSSGPAPSLLHLPVARCRSTSPAESRDRSPSVGTGRNQSPSVEPGRDRSPSSDIVPPTSPLLAVSAADRAPLAGSDVDAAVKPDDLLQLPTVWDSASDPSTAVERQRPASLYSRRRMVLKAIREKSLSIDVDLQRPPAAANDAIMPRS